MNSSLHQTIKDQHATVRFGNTNNKRKVSLPCPLPRSLSAFDLSVKSANLARGETLARRDDDAIVNEIPSCIINKQIETHGG